MSFVKQYNKIMEIKNLCWKKKIPSYHCFNNKNDKDAAPYTKNKIKTFFSKVTLMIIFEVKMQRLVLIKKTRQNNYP